MPDGGTPSIGCPTEGTHGHSPKGETCALETSTHVAPFLPWLRVSSVGHNGWSAHDRHQAEQTDPGARLQNGARGLASGQVLVHLLITGRECPFAVPLLQEELEDALYGVSRAFFPALPVFLALTTGVENLKFQCEHGGPFSQKETKLLKKD